MYLKLNNCKIAAKMMAIKTGCLIIVLLIVFPKTIFSQETSLMINRDMYKIEFYTIDTLMDNQLVFKFSRMDKGKVKTKAIDRIKEVKMHQGSSFYLPGNISKQTSIIDNTDYVFVNFISPSLVLHKDFEFIHGEANSEPYRLSEEYYPGHKKYIESFKNARILLNNGSFSKAFDVMGVFYEPDCGFTPPKIFSFYDNALSIRTQALDAIIKKYNGEYLEWEKTIKQNGSGCLRLSFMDTVRNKIVEIRDDSVNFKSFFSWEENSVTLNYNYRKKFSKIAQIFSGLETVYYQKLESHTEGLLFSRIENHEFWIQHNTRRAKLLKYFTFILLHSFDTVSPHIIQSFDAIAHQKKVLVEIEKDLSDNWDMTCFYEDLYILMFIANENIKQNKRLLDDPELLNNLTINEIPGDGNSPGFPQPYGSVIRAFSILAGNQQSRVNGFIERIKFANKHCTDLKMISLLENAILSAMVHRRQISTGALNTDNLQNCLHNFNLGLTNLNTGEVCKASGFFSKSLVYKKGFPLVNYYKIFSDLECKNVNGHNHHLTFTQKSKLENSIQDSPPYYHQPTIFMAKYFTSEKNISLGADEFLNNGFLDRDSCWIYKFLKAKLFYKKAEYLIKEHLNESSTYNNAIIKYLKIVEENLYDCIDNNTYDAEQYFLLAKACKSMVQVKLSKPTTSQSFRKWIQSNPRQNNTGFKYIYSNLEKTLVNFRKACTFGQDSDNHSLYNDELISFEGEYYYYLEIIENAKK